MSTPQVTHEVLRALEELQDSLPGPDEPIYAWFDAHQDPLAVVLAVYGPKRTGEFLDLSLNSLNSWRRRRGRQDSRSVGNSKALQRVRSFGELDSDLNYEEEPLTQGSVIVQGRPVPEIDLNLIQPNPWQPRMSMDSDGLQELAESIAAHGLLQTPVGRPLDDGVVQLAFGHRRVAAIRHLAEQGRWEGGVPVMVKALTDQEMVTFAFEENMKRKDLTPLEEYRGYQKAIDEVEGLTITDLAASLGINRSTLSNNLRILILPPVVLERFESGEMSAHAAREFLCLMNDDHVHEEDMAQIVREIATTGGARGAPDWSWEHVRRLIRHGVLQGTDSWRPLDKSEGSDAMGNGGYDQDVAHYPGPTFGIEDFKTELPTMVHNIPAKNGASANWTCDVREWRRRQSAGTRAENKARAESGETAAPKTQRDQVLVDVLKKDPVMAEVKKEVETAAVSQTTRASEVVVASAAVLYAGGDARAQEYRQLNAHVAAYLPLVEGEEARTTFRNQAGMLADSLGLSELTTQEIEVAVGHAVDAYERELAWAHHKQAATITAPNLSERQSQQMGTRAQLVELGRFNGWAQRLAPERIHEFPFGFPDVEECLTKCTWGATYGRQWDGEIPTLYCLNQGHFQEKVERGISAMKVKIQEGSAIEEKEDQEIAADLQHALTSVSLATGGISALQRVAKALMQLQGEHVLATPAGSRRAFLDLAYEYSTTRRIKEILGIRPRKDEDRFYNWSWVFDFNAQALASVEALSHEDLLDLVGQLVAYTFRSEAAKEGQR